MVFGPKARSKLHHSRQLETPYICFPLIDSNLSAIVLESISEAWVIFADSLPSAKLMQDKPQTRQSQSVQERDRGLLDIVGALTFHCAAF